MKTNGNDKALEAYKIFPYVAWALIIGFAFFVYDLTVTLKSAVTDLQHRTQYLEQQVSDPNGAFPY